MMNLMDLFKIKNNLLVGRDAFISGDLFVSGRIIEGDSYILDCGTPTQPETSGGSNGR
jgi:hypothetical protein